MSVNNTPIVNQSTLYVSDLEITWASNTTLTIAPGAARDSTNTVDIVVGNYLQSNAANITLNAATNGANGLDTGSLANSTWYAVHAIGSSLNASVNATLLSTSATAPILPSGYDCFRRIGWVRTDGSAHLLKVYIEGNAKTRTYRYDVVQSAKTSGGNSAYTALSLSSFMPSTSTEVYLQYNLIANTAGNSFNLRPTGSSSVSNVGASNPVTVTAILGMINGVTNTSQSIDWKTLENADALTLWVAGFTDYI